MIFLEKIHHTTGSNMKRTSDVACINCEDAINKKTINLNGEGNENKIPIQTCAAGRT